MANVELLNLISSLGALKSLPRTGWLRAGISDPESVAEHSFRTAFIAMLIGDALELDTKKLLKMALLHDLPEILTGDITPHDKLSTTMKSENEHAAIKQLLKGIPGGKNYIDLWIEFENQNSQEAKIIKAIDKFEMLVQAVEYSREYPDKDLNEFIMDAKKQIEIPELRELVDELLKK
jgi:5'-deoxynucleotidase YfbR-like HD superfamily hydrolase